LLQAQARLFFSQPKANFNKVNEGKPLQKLLLFEGSDVVVVVVMR